jgi:adenine-specific DNA-methyltransferase
VTKPRVKAAITGRTPDGEDISGDYKFVDPFPMSDGFVENAAFFTLTYEAPISVGHNRA